MQASNVSDNLAKLAFFGRDQAQRLRLALTDLGAIAYTNAQHVRQDQLANAKTVQQSENTLRRLTGLSSTDQDFTSYLSTALPAPAEAQSAAPEVAPAPIIEPPAPGT